MIRYFLNDDGDRATAESDAAAQRLEVKGFVACTADAHRQAWAAENARRLVEVRMADLRAMRDVARWRAGTSVGTPRGWS